MNGEVKGGDQVGCEPRSEVVKIQKKKFLGGGGGSGEGGGAGRGRIRGWGGSKV